MPSERSKFAIQEMPTAAQHRLMLSGVMGHPDASQLQSVMDRICVGQRTRIILDLSELASIDSSGMHCLTAAYQTAIEHGHELDVVPGSQIEEVCQLVEVLASLPLAAPADPALLLL